MTAEGAIEFEALETQAARLMGHFVEAGYERVAPAFIQPASLFLDWIGEALRARTYVFSDPNGEELCLRPDLTLPVCRIFLERLGRGDTRSPAKFCYNGPAFRIQDGAPDPLRPREFRQAGIECFGNASQDADLEVFALTMDAVRRGGVKTAIVRAGHLGLFKVLLDVIEMPSRWRERLLRAFWRPQAFGRELASLSRTPDSGKRPAATVLSEEGLLRYLDAESIPFVGLRHPDEIVARLRDKSADAEARPLPQQSVQLLRSYLHISGPADAALTQVETLLRPLGETALRAVERARDLLVNMQQIAGEAPIFFNADFGRHFEYYTGIVFQIEIEGSGQAGNIAGGGRYDGLIRALSAGGADVPAVGATVHTERLLAALRGQP